MKEVVNYKEIKLRYRQYVVETYFDANDKHPLSCLPSNAFSKNKKYNKNFVNLNSMFKIPLPQTGRKLKAPTLQMQQLY